MARTLNSYDFDQKSRFSADRSNRYPWPDWFNGEIWELKRGVDFDVPTLMMERILRTRASANGCTELKIHHALAPGDRRGAGAKTNLADEVHLVFQIQGKTMKAPKGGSANKSVASATKKVAAAKAPTAKKSAPAKSPATKKSPPKKVPAKQAVASAEKRAAAKKPPAKTPAKKAPPAKAKAPTKKAPPAPKVEETTTE